MVIGKQIKDNHITEDEVSNLTFKAFKRTNVENKCVLVIIPDLTRTAPIDIFFKIFFNIIGNSVKKLDYIIALGTHPELSKKRILNMVGITSEEREKRYRNVNFFNHKWNDPKYLKTIGTIPAVEIKKISNGMLEEDVKVTVNKIIFDYDQLIIIGPVFPHEVAGFSGGNKYFFPGISGPEMVNFTHWLGALLTNLKINGIKYTPVRFVIDKAASFINIPKLCFCLVVRDKKLYGLFIGKPEEAWSKAADLSANLNVVYKEKAYKKVLSIAPKMYEDLWTGGKAMYKLEAVVEEGGDLIIYAPHINEVSYTHGELIDKVGYHVRDYFLKQKEKFSWVPGAIKAHSTHVKGMGTYKNGKEKPRINVTLATGIPESRCKKINLGYINPNSINLLDWENREDEGILLVPDAGEILYRLKSR